MLESVIQRRWLLRNPRDLTFFLKSHGGFFDSGMPPVHIEDRLFLPPAQDGSSNAHYPLRIRKEGSTPPTLTFKQPGASAEERHTLTMPISHEFYTAVALLPPVVKRRHFSADGAFVLDIYPSNDDHPQLTILEQRAIADGWGVLPGWTRAFDPLEVTGYMHGVHIALIRQRMVAPPAAGSPAENNRSAIPVIVLTGAPCSGKTSILRRLQEDKRVHLVPEAATMAITDLLCKPPTSLNDHAGHQRFQLQIRSLQTLLEQLAQQNAREHGARVIVVDRGVVDGYAYLPDIDRDGAYVRFFARPRAADFPRYQAVIQLALPPEDVYNRRKRDNPARREDYASATDLDQLMTHAWKDHPGYHLIPNGAGWEDKLAATMSLLERLITS